MTTSEIQVAKDIMVAFLSQENPASGAANAEAAAKAVKIIFQAVCEAVTEGLSGESSGALQALNKNQLVLENISDCNP
jgi:hypothetical protein